MLQPAFSHTNRLLSAMTPPSTLPVSTARSVSWGTSPRYTSRRQLGSRHQQVVEPLFRGEPADSQHHWNVIFRQWRGLEIGQLYTVVHQVDTIPGRRGQLYQVLRVIAGAGP